MLQQQQLKLNLNAVVDNMNLVNVTHKPEPILINKTAKFSNYSRLDPDRNVNFNIQPSFEYIDEEKLSMYAFLAKRELKNKEWMASENNYNNRENQLNESVVSVVREKPPARKSSLGMGSTGNSIGNSKAFSRNVPVNKGSNQLDSERLTTARSLVSSHRSEPVMPPNKLEFSEMKKCYMDTVRSFEYLQKQLDEFKYERLKVVYNDPQDEDKQKRIQVEQIKYLSRSMYNLQNQISSFKTSFKSAQNPQQFNPLLKRTIHTMRQVTKSIQSFADTYPYRPSNDKITEKLCAHFYKQLQLSIENYTECIVECSKNNLVNDLNMEIIQSKLSSLLIDCNRYFVEEAEETSKESAPKQMLHERNQGKDLKNQQRVKNALRIVKTSDQHQVVKKKKPLNHLIKKAVKPMHRPKAFKINNVKEKKSSAAFNIDFSPTRKAHDYKVFEKKTVQVKTYPNRSRSTESIENCYNQEHIPLNESQLNRSYSSVTSDAFKRMSSPTIASARKMGYVKDQHNKYRSNSADRLYETPTRIRHRSRSNQSTQSLNSIMQTPLRSNQFQSDVSVDQIGRSLENLRQKYEERGARASRSSKFLFDFNKSYEYKPDYLIKIKPNKRELTSILKSRSVSPSKGDQRFYAPTTEGYLARLDQIKRESDLIRRKYEKISYEDGFANSNGFRRPYEECYLENTNSADTDECQENEVIHEDMFLKLNKPSDGQLKRVLDYANKFADYSQKTCVTTIGDSQFDDFELFEYLSDELYDQFLNNVYDEVEKINEDLVQNMVNDEFVMETQQNYRDNSNNDSNFSTESDD